MADAKREIGTIGALADKGERAKRVKALRVRRGAPLLLWGPLRRRRFAHARSPSRGACRQGQHPRQELAAPPSFAQVRYHPDRNLSALRELYEELSKYINAETDRLLAG